jgi:hypothetical protein
MVCIRDVYPWGILNLRLDQAMGKVSFMTPTNGSRGDHQWIRSWAFWRADATIPMDTQNCRRHLDVYKDGESCVYFCSCFHNFFVGRRHESEDSPEHIKQGSKFGEFASTRNNGLRS